MNLLAPVRKVWSDVLSAVQFLTRVPVPSQRYEADSLARSVKYFPLVGILIGGGAAVLHLLLAPHLSRLAAAFCIILFLVMMTGCLHEDGLADSADGFGGGCDREQILLIMRDSRIGTYAGAALIFSLLGRVFFLSSIPLPQVVPTLIVAQVLCRWTTLPLSYFLPSARTREGENVDGLGGRIAWLTSKGTLMGGTIFSFAVALLLLKTRALAPIVCSIALCLVSGRFYKLRVGGVTGDCFGATNQLTELAIYVCGAWS